MTTQFAEETYTKGHMLKVKALDTITVVVGLLLAASPFIEHNFPGDFDTTVHVALGMLIAAPAAFRVAVAYGSLWVEVVLFVFGLLTFLMPRFEHMQWNPRYNIAHLVAGGLIMGVSIISGLITVPVLKKQ